jgi:RNA polymerase sigma factor (sigma-70 family)
MGADIDDQSLVASIRAGDDHAFEQLYHRYQRRIGAYIYGMVHDHGRAEDITQDVFMSALRRLRATEAPIAFKPWLYEIAKNACIDAFRRSRRAEEISYDADDGTERLHLVSNGPTPDAAVDTRMSLDHLRGAFGGLSEAHHQILVMRELEGLSYREIGERLGMSRPSVESTLFRARRRLSEEYEELVSGERCRRIQSIIAGATGGRVGVRDERKMARHVSYCQPCRRAAFAAGFDPATLEPRRTAREKIAALLPLPAFLKRWVAGPGSGDHGTLWSAAAHYAEPATGGWAKVAAAAAALVVAGVGVDTVRPHNGAAPDRSGAPATAPARSAPPTRAIDLGAPPTGRVGHKQPPRQGSSTSSRPGKRAPSQGAKQGSATTSGGSSASPSSSNPSSGSGASSGGGDTPLDTVRHAASGATGGGGATSGVDVKAPAVQLPTPQLPSPQVSTPQLPSVPDAPPAVNGAVDTVNGALRTTTGAVNTTTATATGTVNGTLSGTTDAANATVGGVTGGSILGG